MKKHILKLLFRLLQDRTYQGIDDQRISKWLAYQFKEMGFRDYFQKRDLQHLKVLGTGLNQEQYWIRMGQRLELLMLLDSVNKAYKKSEKEKGRSKIKKK